MQMAQASPTALMVTHELLHRGSKLERIEQAFDLEYTVALNMMVEGGDFFEGVRAVLVDKDHRPHWRPSALGDVTNTADYFKTVPDRQRWAPLSE